jgi:hypothetical protein
MRRAGVGVVCLAILVAGMLGWSAMAAAGWKSFGKAWAQGEGPFVSVSSEAGGGPNKVRFVVAAQGRRIKGHWRFECTSASFDYTSRSGSFRSPLTPVVKTFTNPFGSASKCRLDVSAYHLKKGPLTVSLQRR